MYHPQGLLKIGVSLSLSGRYARMGLQAHAALRLFEREINESGGLKLGQTRLRVSVVCQDDQSEPSRCRQIYRRYCFERGADVILGPYGSDLVRAAAPIAEESGMVMVNHGGAADDIHQSGWRTIVGVLSPASTYFSELVNLISHLKFWRKRIALISFGGGFAKWVIDGFIAECAKPTMRYRGIAIRYRDTIKCDERALVKVLDKVRRNKINILVSAGSFEQDVALMRRAVAPEYNLPVLACVAAGVNSFANELGPLAEGILGPSQWEPDSVRSADLGPNSEEFVRRFAAFNPNVVCDYPAVQAYAAAQLAIEAVRRVGEVNQVRLRQAFNDMRIRTCYGDFAIDPETGRQVGHRVLLVQWSQGKKRILRPELYATSDQTLFHTGLRLLHRPLRWILRLRQPNFTTSLR